MQRLNALDAAFLDLETDESRANVAWFSVFEGPAPDHGELVRYIEGKLALVPRYRQKLRFLPLGIARPLWIDDPNFNLDYHIRRTALPAPGGEEQLTRLFARVVSQQLDRSHPLWEMWVAEGHSWAGIAAKCELDIPTARREFREEFEIGTRVDHAHTLRAWRARCSANCFMRLANWMTRRACWR